MVGHPPFRAVFLKLCSTISYFHISISPFFSNMIATNSFLELLSITPRQGEEKESLQLTLYCYLLERGVCSHFSDKGWVWGWVGMCSFLISRRKHIEDNDKISQNNITILEEIKIYFNSSQLFSESPSYLVLKNLIM